MCGGMRHAALVVLLLPALAHAGQARGWLQVVGQGSLVDRLGVYLELQPRASTERLEELLIRGALNVRVADGLTAWGGYLFNPDLGSGHEHRLWEQLQLEGDTGPVRSILRVRLEQRFLEGGPPGAAHRLRVLARGVFPLPAPWYLAASDELFGYLADAGGPPTRGLDQNRLYAGVGLRLGDSNLEAGYLLQSLFRPGGDEARHVLMLQLVTDPFAPLRG